MIKITRKVRDHLAKAVLTPLSLAVGGFLAAQGWTTGSVGLLLYGAFLFLCIQAVAVMLLAYDEQEK
jgi:hypothetical protein